jgi:uncharacterized protein
MRPYIRKILEMSMRSPGQVQEIVGFFKNPVFLSACFSLCIAQVVKAIISLVKTRARSFREVITILFWKTGGMPSSHSALATSIATAIGITGGMNSNIFILSMFFALVVIRDAMGVRRSSGIQARVLNQLGKELQGKLKIQFHPVKEVHGHTPSEVLVGILLGFFISLAFCLL